MFVGPLGVFLVPLFFFLHGLRIYSLISPKIPFLKYFLGLFLESITDFLLHFLHIIRKVFTAFYFYLLSIFPAMLGLRGYAVLGNPWVGMHAF